MKSLSSQNRKAILITVIAVLALWAAPGRAGIDTTAVAPLYDGVSDPWMVGSDMVIGFEASGTLTIDNGSDVLLPDASAFIGSYDAEYSDTSGTVLLTGLGSSWEISDMLIVGPLAQGFLTTGNQASLTAVDIIIGGAPVMEEGEGDDDVLVDILNGTGTATVSGGAQWQSYFLAVGAGGPGTLTIDTEAAVSGQEAVIGIAPDANGVVTVDDGTWTPSDYLAVGLWGDGELSIANGGLVESGMGWVGGTDPNIVNINDAYLTANGNPTGTGTVSVNDPNSRWDAGTVLTVGAWGDGTLDITDGGAVEAQEIFIGGVSHEVLGEAWDANELMDGTGAVLVSGTGSTLDATGTDSLYVGYSGTGTLDVNDGADVTAGMVIIGGASDANGIVTVADDGSTLTVDEGIIVGAWGTGELTIGNGADVTAYEMMIGGFDVNDSDLDPAMIADLGDAEGTGTVTVTGPGSTLDVYGDDTLVVGSGGTGTLLVEDGAEVSAIESFIGGYTVFEEEELTETAVFFGGTGTATVTDANSMWTTETLAVGAGGDGTLDVLAGGEVTSNMGVIGLGPNGTGTATVSGVGSAWNVIDSGRDAEELDGTLTVGMWGEGTLMVADGGDVNATTLYIGGGEEDEIDGEVVWNLGDPNGTGTVTVTGDESVLRVLPSEGGGSPETTYIGYSGEGTLNILDGGLVESDAAIVGVLENGVGTVLVDGNDSTWSIVGGGGVPALSAQGDGNVFVSNGGLVDVNGVDASLDVAGMVAVGSEGDGTMTISGDGTVTAYDVFLGGYAPLPGFGDDIREYLDPNAVLPDGAGTVTVTDGGTLVSEGLSVGIIDEGTLNVTNGGQVISEWAEIGTLPDAVGTATVSGEGSRWDLDYEMVVGAYGQGNLTIADGGVASASEVYVGGAPLDLFTDDPYDPNLLPNGTGTVTVSGEGSELNVFGPDTLYVGYFGDGTLDVNDGGYVSADAVIVGAGPDAVGTVTVDGEGSSMDAGEVIVGAWGQGDVAISGGAQIDASEVLIGGFDSSDADLDPDMLEDFGPAEGVGTVTVTGAGSELNVYGRRTLYAGYSGDGTLDVNDGGYVSADSVIVGTGPDAVGTVTVDGQGSSMEAGDIIVGAWGQGDMTISAGADVTASEVLVGGLDANDADLDPDMLAELGAAEGIGAVTVTGEGSTLTVTDLDTLVIGGWGTGTVTAEDSAAVVADRVIIGGYDPDHETLAAYFDPNADLGDGTGTLTVTGGASLVAGDLDAGFSGDGTLVVSNGGEVTAGGLFVGTLSDVVGTVEVTGPNSLVAVSDDIVVGTYGQGTMTIANGGQVTAAEVSIGGTSLAEDFNDAATYPADGTGTVTVTGAGSVLEVVGGNTLYVGYSGDGTLNVLNGGLVETDAAIVGVEDGSSGLVTVDGTGSTLSIIGGGGVPLLAAQGEGDVIVSNGGQVDVNGLDASLDVGGAITVGSEGQGTMTIAGGATVGSDSGVIGGYDPELDTFAEYVDIYTDLSQGTGTVTVDGSGTTWTADSVMVGLSGTGTLNISNGGYVDSEYGLMGLTPDAVGDANLASGSMWTVSDMLAVGVWGDATMDISGASSVYASNAYVGGVPFSLIGGEYDPNLAPDGTGAVNVSGEGSGLYVDGGLFVGYSDGSVTISDGAVVTAENAVVIGGLDLDEFGLEGPGGPNGIGAVTVTGSGSLLETDAMAVGTTGLGTLDVLDGAQVDAGLAIIGFGPDANGVATVDGPGSAWTLNDEIEGDNWSLLNVGGYGQGQLTISNGGRVTVADAVVGGVDLEDVGAESYYDIWGDPNGNGSILVTDANSLLDVGYDVCIGHTGTGVMTVTNGGGVTSASGFIGDYAGASGQVAVTGSSSQWTLADELFVGYEGAGALTISDGGMVVADESAYIGFDPLGTGTVSVTGDGSTFWAGYDLYIGGDDESAQGSGSVFVNDGGHVKVFNELFVWETGLLGGDGTVTVYSPETLYNYGTIAPGNDGIGTLTVNGNVIFEPNSVYSVDISNDSADLLDVNGVVTIEGGTVRVDSATTVVGEHDYQIVTADAVTGTFDVLDTALLHFAVNDPNLSYDPNSIWLHLAAANFDDPNIAQTYNQQQVAGSLQTIADGGGNNVTKALQRLETHQSLRGAYDELSGRRRAPLAPVTVAGTSRFLGMVTSRVQNVQGGVAGAFDRPSLYAMAGPDSSVGDGRTYEAVTPGFGVGNGTRAFADSRWGVWGRGYGLYGDRETETEMPGYTYNVHGGSIGLDYQVSETWLGGLVAGLSDGDVDFAGSPDTTDFEAQHVGLYASGVWEKWYVDAVATAASLEYDTQRYVSLLDEQLTANFDGYELAGYIETGQRWDLGPNLRLQPLASLQYAYLSLDGYTESGGAGALSFEKQTHESVKGSVGARLTRKLAESMSGFRADLQLRGRYVHEFGDSQSSVDTAFASDPGAVFNVRDAEITRDSAVLGAGIAAHVNDRTRIYVDFDTRLNGDESIHMFSAALQYRW